MLVGFFYLPRMDLVTKSKAQNNGPELTKRQKLLAEYCQELLRIIKDQRHWAYHDFLESCIGYNSLGSNRNMSFIDSNHVIDYEISVSESFEVKRGDGWTTSETVVNTSRKLYIREIKGYESNLLCSLELSETELEELSDLNRVFRDNACLRWEYGLDDKEYPRGYLLPGSLWLAHILFLNQIAPVGHSMKLDAAINILLGKLTTIRKLKPAFRVCKLQHGAFHWKGVDKDDYWYESSYLWTKSIGPKYLKTFGPFYDDENLVEYDLSFCEELFGFEGKVARLQNRIQRGENTTTKFFIGYKWISYFGLMSLLVKLIFDIDEPKTFRSKRSCLDWDYDEQIKQRIIKLDYSLLMI